MKKLLKPLAIAAMSIAISALAVTTSASAAEIVAKPCDPHRSNCRLIGIFGDIKAGDVEKFAKVIKDNNTTEAAVFLNSDGGSLVDGLEIGREIKKLGFTTLVLDNWRCASACASIWLAGSRRFYEDVMGLERLAEDWHFAAYEAGPNILLLFQKGSADHRVETPHGAIPPHDAAGRQHLALAVPAGELDAWAARLGQAGIAIESRMRWPPGGASLFFRDPDGHLLELATPGLWRNYR